MRLLAELKERNRARYLNKFTPEWFLNECLDLDGISLASYQREMVHDVFETDRACWRAPRGAGKSAGAAIAIWAFILKHHMAGHEWKVATTASVFRQLSRFLWPEVHKWGRRIKWDVLGLNKHEFEILMTEIKGPTGTAFAMSSNDPDLLEGVHADYLLLVLDEAKAIPPVMWDALEGALGSGECHVFAISTPGPPLGRFFDIHNRKRGLDDWTPKRITLQDSIAEGRVSAGWAEQRRKQYGEGSAVYRNYVLGEFSTEEEGGLIPLEWIEAAMARYPQIRPEPTQGGIDVAGEGDDTTVLAYGCVGGVNGLKQWAGIKEQELANNLLAASQEIMVPYPSERLKKFNIDSIGIGGTICMLLEQAGMSVFRFCGSASGGNEDGIEFANLRALGYWNLRQLLNPESDNPIWLPPDDDLMGELTSLKTVPDAHGRLKVVEKAKIKTSLGRSPDKADAVMYCMWEVTGGAIGWEVVKSTGGIDIGLI